MAKAQAKPEPKKEPKPPKKKHPKGSLEALDPETSDSDDDDEESDDPADVVVLDMNLPRTAMVINVSHVLKRLDGTCSLNQLNKSLKNFKESTGVSLETFLRG